MRFPLFSKDFRGSAKRKTLAFLGKSPCFFQKNKDWRVRVLPLHVSTFKHMLEIGVIGKFMTFVVGGERSQSSTSPDFIGNPHTLRPDRPMVTYRSLRALPGPKSQKCLQRSLFGSIVRPKCDWVEAQCAHPKHCYPETPLGSHPSSRVPQIQRNVWGFAGIPERRRRGTRTGLLAS